MIKFFRRIRRKLVIGGNLKKYLIYAVGEIILVMIGILLALQVNNWNERNKSKEELDYILETIQDDLKEDLPKVYAHIDYMENKISLIDSVIQKQIPIETINSCYMCTNAHGWIKRLNLPNKGYKMLSSYSASNNVHKDILVNNILEFYKEFEDNNRSRDEKVYDNIWDNRMYQMENIDFTLQEWIMIVNTWTTNEDVTTKFLSDEENLKRMIWHKALLKVYLQGPLKFYKEEGELLLQKLSKRPAI